MSTYYQNLNDVINQNLTSLLQKTGKNLQKSYDKVTDMVDQEFLIPLTAMQINEMLGRFVVKNVQAILDLHLDIHDGWFRLYATINVMGIFASVACNFKLVQARLDRDVQRFVFQQISNTEVLQLHCQSYPKNLAIKLVVWWFHRVLKKDPLGFILQKIHLAEPKEDILYLDIGRWLRHNKKIMQTLHKVQVNHAILNHEQLILKANVNVADVFNMGRSDVLISEQDNPNPESSTPTQS